MSAPVRPQPMQPERAASFRAWRIGESGIAHPEGPIDAVSMDDAADILARQSSRGERYAILCENAGAASNVVRLVLVRKRARGSRRWSHAVGGFVEDGSTYAETQGEFQVDQFAPTRPFDAFRDDPVGRDRNLVES